MNIFRKITVLILAVFVSGLLLGDILRVKRTQANSLCLPEPGTMLYSGARFCAPFCWVFSAMSAVAAPFDPAFFAGFRTRERNISGISSKQVAAMAGHR